MKKTVAGATEGRELKKTRRSTRLLSKRTAVQLNKEETERDNKEETEHDDKPEEVTFIQGAAQAKEERQLVTNAAIKTSETLRRKRRGLAERNRLQKEAKRANAMQRLPDEILEAVARKQQESTEDSSLQNQESSDDEDDGIVRTTDTNVNQVDHQSFDVVTVDQVVNKPRKLNTHALSFKQKHLYGDRLKRVDGLTFMSLKLKRHGPAVNFRQVNS
ncbi:nucleolar protein 7-like [Corticium candelabrum]|uniref:nucleolar protein 7-like n=1 Tax=Corticium candelabrum TaxID=121492 RepID=UPI002E253DEA|nr:nucleolar protein 7-like [Corticium candelabrum]